MSDADRVNMAFVEEVTFGVSPSASMDRLRFTSEGLNMETDTVQSAEITSDRTVKDLIRTNIRGAGDINVELSYDVIDDFLQAALFSAGGASAIALAPGGNTVITTNTFHSTAGTPFSVYSVGQWVATQGHVNAANNGVFKIEAINGGGDDLVVSGGTLVNESAVAATFIQGAQVVNGTTLNSYTIEREYADISNEFEVFRGMSVDSISLNIAINSIITAAISFVGKDAASATTSPGSGYTAAPTNDVMNTIDHVAKVIEGDGSNVSVDITALTMQIANNLRTRMQLANLGAISIGQGKFVPTGTYQKYFASKTLMDKYLNQTASALAVVLQVGTTEAYVIEFPLVKFHSGQRIAGGENTDIIADLGWTALKHPTEAVSMRITKWPDVTP